MKPTILVGGQAVIEGVMMRVPGAYATAVRDPMVRFILTEKTFNLLVKNHGFGNNQFSGEWQDSMSQ